VNEVKNALDRTAMSAGLGVFVDSQLAAALIAVGQLDRYASWSKEH
jgi:hypothetical protein